MMTKTYSHYESLNVTRDAPTEVIRAAYRSLSQKYHPDKNMGNQEAAQVMARLNAAYSVLSDSDQREQYDLQLMSYPAPGMHDDAPATGANSFFHQVRDHVKGWNGRVVAMLFGFVSIVLIPAFWLVWKDNQTMLQIGQGMTYSADVPATPVPGMPTASKQQADSQAGGARSGKATHVKVIQLSGPSGLDVGAADQPAPAAAPKAPATPSAPTKASDYERLTAMLKSMGLGLHKLESPAPAPVASAKPAPIKPAAPVKAAETATAVAAAPAPAQAAAPAAPPEPSRVREEKAAPDPVRSETKSLADASRASAPPAASSAAASASHAPRAVIAEARSCAPPPYPINAYRNGETGSVLLALLVGSDGHVIQSKVQKSSGSSELDTAARKALSLCKFKPMEGQAEPTWANLTYVWSID